MVVARRVGTEKALGTLCNIVTKNEVDSTVSTLAVNSSVVTAVKSRGALQGLKTPCRDWHSCKAQDAH